MLAACFAPRAARAADSEVTFDLNTGHFSSTLPYMKPVTLSVMAPVGTVFNFSYWRKAGRHDACGEPPPKSEWDDTHFAVVTAAPVGDAANGARKLSAAVGPFSVAHGYCFAVDAKVRSALTDAQKQALTEAVFAWVRVLTPRPGEDVGALLKANLAAEINVRANSDPAFISISVPNARSIGELVASRFDSDFSVKQQLIAANFNANNFNLQTAFATELQNLAPLVQPNSGDADYEPVRSIEAVRKVLASRPKAELKKDPAPGDDGIFEWLRKHSTLLEGLINRSLPTATSLSAETVADLVALRDASSTPKPLRIAASDVRALAAAIVQANPKPLEAAAAAKQLLDANPDAAIAKKASWPRAGTGAYFDVIQVALVVQGRKLDTLPATAAQLRVDKGAWEVFLADVQVERPLLVNGAPIPVEQPSVDDAFPAYIGLDVGVAMGWFPDTKTIRGTVAPIQYFGLSAGLAPVDKNDSLDASGGLGHQLGQRLSVTAGVQLLRPSYLDKYGVSGLLADRMLMLGGGLRITTYVRLGAGAVFYRYTNPVAFIDQSMVTAAPYVSLSIDFDVFGTISGKYSKLLARGRTLMATVTGVIQVGAPGTNGKGQYDVEVTPYLDRPGKGWVHDGQGDSAPWQSFGGLPTTVRIIGQVPFRAEQTIVSDAVDVTQQAPIAEVTPKTGSDPHK